MTKRSQKLFRKWRKRNAGCMRGLISIFDFRQRRSTKKLLSNKRCGSARDLGISNARNKIDLSCKLEENQGDTATVFNLYDTESDDSAMVNQHVSTISTLMEKEMSRATQSRKEFSSKTEWIKTELGTEATSDKYHNEVTKNAALSFDKKVYASPSLKFQQSNHPDMPAMLSPDLDLNAFMLNYCSNFLECEKNSLEYKIMTGKHLNPHRNQLLGEHPGTKKLQKQNDDNFLRNREKLTAVGQSNESHDAKSLDRIVVLKPTHVRNHSLSNTIAPISSISSHCGVGNREGRENLSSYFSLKEIKRRFIDVIGSSRKVKDPIAMDGVLHKIPYGKQITRATEKGEEKRLGTRVYEKKNVSSVASEVNGGKKLNKNSASRIVYTEASFCNEARRHLTDFLQIGTENESIPPIHVSKALGRMLSFPGFNYLSPRLSPAREKDEHVQENSSSLLCDSKKKNGSEHLELFSLKDSFANTEKNLETKNGTMEIIEIEEVSQSEAQSVLLSNENDHPNKAFKEEESSMILELEQSEMRFESPSPSTPTAMKSSEIQEFKETECAMDATDRPSPISVLEPLFFEHASNPSSMLSWRFEANGEAQTQPGDSQIENSAAALGSIDGEDDLISCTEFNEALLFDELEASCITCIVDPKLLFDFIDEVLSEIKERHLSVASWVFFIKPTILTVFKHEYFMKEACRRINWHLNVQFPNTLQQSIKKDLDSTVWIDLRSGAENTVSEIGDYILDCLFEEISQELLDCFFQSSSS